MSAIFKFVVTDENFMRYCGQQIPFLGLQDKDALLPQDRAVSVSFLEDFIKRHGIKNTDTTNKIVQKVIKKTTMCTETSYVKLMQDHKDLSLCFYAIVVCVRNFQGVRIQRERGANVAWTISKFRCRSRVREKRE